MFEDKYNYEFRCTNEKNLLEVVETLKNKFQGYDSFNFYLESKNQYHHSDYYFYNVEIIKNNQSFKYRLFYSEDFLDHYYD